jgi:hypothetical protein
MLSVQIQICIAYYRVFITPKVHWTFYTIGGIPTKACFLHDILTAVYTVTVILLARITLTDIAVLFILFLSDSGRIESLKYLTDVNHSGDVVFTLRVYH